MNIPSIITRAKIFTMANSPALLTAAGVGGAVWASYLTGTATFRAAELIAEAEVDAIAEETWSAETLSPRQKVELCWKEYIPAGLVLTISVAAIIGANRIGTRRAAAFASAYTITEKAYSEYKDKVVEKFGTAKEKEVREAIAQDKIIRYPPQDVGIIHTGDGEVLFRDDVSGRYFYSSMEAVKRAENNVNKQVIAHDSAMLTNFYSALKIPNTSIGDSLGWTHEKYLELDISTSTTPDDSLPCHTINYEMLPMMNHRVGLSRFRM